MSPRCPVHPGKDAVGACVGCGQFVCEICRVTISGRIWCKRCVEQSESPTRISTGGNRLYRSSRDRLLGGVCGGLAEHLDADPTLVRVISALCFILTGFVPLAIVYIVLWAVIPLEP